MTSQLIYDLTPFKYPQFHTEATCRGFQAFFERISNHFDHIVYGGRTAQNDGIAVQNEHHWRSPASGHIEFGSDIHSGRLDKPQFGQISDEEILARLGIKSNFVITVGTIEPRKNHEVLYKAYLTLLRQDRLKEPLQMIFVGKRGWNSGDLLATLEDDDRVRGRILIMSPSDEQLDVLYRHCLFTLLPSFYEGWSLTLPESLSYGKLCLASDVEPLREIGGELVEYIHPLDTYAWADRIADYANDRSCLDRRESRIKNLWKPGSWRQSAKMLIEELDGAHKEAFRDLFAKSSGD
jgi:glycosyltransferase involved in cell wall biosynthesis